MKFRKGEKWERNFEVVRRVQGGESMASVARSFGVSNTLIRFIVERDARRCKRNPEYARMREQVSE